ncbi:right-handed parallel beta-helix repeat-containing protein [Mycolicibacterium litorale]|uniref:Lipoprotein n=1 Tax=Mycolicibacterium litorale TaxID=758802 RepID=A0AAD1IT52_9MYCO|nr:right-handed parallel beta-helix repeat-containing protein [Mycolicibacterium litorale]MCV7416043.1 right-handed parallel beta-helix repeat-containing protein [Mycolicibacterium litorale]TDY09295.1 parallel beta helix pectate lyase-like protein [Mycolicibacterium litorale]BBY17238.1 lipoprotein [Mycolicibacterium litorale]
MAAVLTTTLVIALAVHGVQAAHSAPPDETVSLQAQFDQLRPGDTIRLERRTYFHHGVLRITVPGVRIDGNGATLAATNAPTSAVLIDAPGVSVTDVTLSAPTDGPRRTGLEQHKLVVGGNGVSLTDVTVDGSAAAGVFVDGVSGFHLTRVTVRDSLADGIHMTDGATNGTLESPRTERTGDDGVAVVSYGTDRPCAGITITAPVVEGTRWGRGISVVGGRDVAIRDITVSGTSGAGVYIASEGDPYFTDSVAGIRVTGGTIAGANTDPAVVHGAVLVYSGHAGHSVSGVSVSDLTITATPPTAQRGIGVIAKPGTVDAIAFRQIRLQDNGVRPLLVDAPAPAVETSDFTVNGTPVDVR